MSNKIFKLVILAVIMSLVIPISTFTQPALAAGPISFSILHTNDFHGQLEPSGSNPGMARVASVVNAVRIEKGTDNVLLVDAGDEMQGSLLSNIQKGEPTIAVYNEMGYAAATFGNHEFDWGQPTLVDRTTQADYPYVSANIVAGTCDPTNWASPSFAVPYVILPVGTAPDQVKVGFIGVTTTETPIITIAEATEGLCFKDPAGSIIHYYDQMKAEGADVIVVLSHLGYTDGGYGYGIPVYGDQTLAKKLIDAGKPVPLIIGGHSHTDVTTPVTPVGGVTTVVQARYNGRQLGQADMTFDPASKAVTVSWKKTAISPTGAQDPTINDLINAYASDPDYQALINTPIGYAQTDLLHNYNGDGMMGNFVDDAIYNYLNNDLTLDNDVDMFFNNAGGIRTNWCDAPDPVNPGGYVWSSNAADCQPGVWAHDPMLLNYGNMFTILPFGNATIVGDMTGAQILELLNQGATLFKGAIQPAGMRYSFFRYSDTKPGPQPYAWGAFDYCVINKLTDDCEPLDMDKTYRVGTNEFLAPAGQDGYLPFKYMTNISYWGDMLNAVNDWVVNNYTMANPYKGPNGDGTLDGRITQDSSIIPITILHHNDSHGNLWKGPFIGYAQLATLIKQEREHNPTRTLLLSSGDNIQGDAMMYYFKSAPLGYAADGTPLPVGLQTHPMMAVMNAMDYDAWTLGNHEFNFGNTIFKAVLKQATFPTLQANLSDTGEYGIAEVPVLPYVETTVGAEGIKLAILGIGNHRVPNYELPSNIPGLSFSDPLLKAQELSTALRPTNDVVVALTHIGFTENPASVEVDANVDTNMALTVSGLDTIIGGHSHTNPVSGFGNYKFLPTIVPGPNNTPVIINQAYRYNNYLGEVILGVRAKAGGGYEVVSRAGQYIAVNLTTTPEDTAIKDIVKPYADQLAAYNNTVLGETTVAIDALKAFTQETNAANLQADSSVYELEVKNGIPVDFHLSGAMTNRAIATTGPYPVTLKVSDMFTLMPYENSLVVLNMNGPELKAVLERAYRNYYWYNIPPNYGGYSYYTTCMLDINAGGKILYKAPYPAVPDGNNVQGLVVDGKSVDFSDAVTHYRVSTVNYLAAGSCNFNDSGVTLWPLDDIANDTQFYVRDAVIDYIKSMGTVSPAIEGRLVFSDSTAPEITITAPEEKNYTHPEFLTIDFAVSDSTGVKSVMATLDGVEVEDGQVIDLYTLAFGNHTFEVTASDWYDNAAVKTVIFAVIATPQSLMDAVQRFYDTGEIDSPGVYNSLMAKLNAYMMALNKGKMTTAANILSAFVNEIMAQAGKHISAEAAALLIADVHWVMEHPNAAANFPQGQVQASVDGSRIFLALVNR